MKHPFVESAVKKAVDANNLQALPSWMFKIIQVYEMCLERHSLMLVGPSGTGKSRIVQVLQLGSARSRSLLLAPLRVSSRKASSCPSRSAPPIPGTLPL
jgi:ABC-type arginine transport system ATPase subunit